MNFIPIFGSKEKSELWSVCYPEDQIDNNLKDIYSILMDDLWSDIQYLLRFIKNEVKSEGYDAGFWNGISTQELIDKIFIQLHQNIYSLNSLNDSHRKARPNISKSIIRLYGIELSDKTIIITGGTLKLKLKMIGEHFDKEMRNLKRVQAFLNSQGIIDRNGLID